MAATISRAAAAAAPPRTFSPSPISSCRRFVRSSSFLGNSGRRASSSDSWTRDKAARTSLAPPPPPIQRRSCVKDMGRASLSDNWVADKRFSVDVTLASAASRGVYVPPPLKKLLLVNTTASPAAAACVDPSPPMPVDTSPVTGDTTPVAVVSAVSDLPTTGCREWWLRQPDPCTFLSLQLLCWSDISQVSRPMDATCSTYRDEQVVPHQHFGLA